MSERSMKLADRQALANALNSASRSGYRGVCEDITERTAWLTAPAVERQDGVPVWDPPRDCRFLVFTSAGDANNVSRWVRDRRDSDSFELCVCYYSSQAEPECLRVADRGLRAKGGKFPNLLEAMRQQANFQIAARTCHPGDAS
jgi:hypothetical protein